VTARNPSLPVAPGGAARSGPLSKLTGSVTAAPFLCNQPESCI